MDDVDLIEAYARQLEAALRRAGRPAQPLVAEATAHLLEDAARIARDEGCSDGEAARRAIARFGDVSEVVAASRRYGRTLAASVARIASIVLLVIMTDLTLGALFGDSDHTAVGWRWTGELVLTVAWLPLYALLGGTTYFLWRALAGRGTPRLLPLALQLNGLVAVALLVGYATSSGPGQYWVDRGLSLSRLAGLVSPLWILVIVQSAAGLRALGTRREVAHA